MTHSMHAGLLRAALLFVPLGLAGAAVLWKRPGSREWAGVLVASVWAFVSIAAVNLWAQGAGLWSFGALGGTHRGAPVDVLLGWTALWGVAFPLGMGRAPLIAALAGALWLDALAMPLAEPVIALGPAWWRGEALSLALCFLPAQLAYRWTRDRRRLGARAAIQALAFGGFSFWFLGDVALVVEAGRTAAVGTVPLTWCLDPVRPAWLLTVALGALMSLSAVQELVGRGGGTPLPWDPPQRLVTSGLYRYVRNPMQVGMWIALSSFGLAYGSGWLAGGALILISFSAGLAQWHEDAEFLPRFGAAGQAYRAGVRWGLPRALPYTPAVASLYYAAGCRACEGVAAWIRSLDPVGLELVPAQSHPERDLDRLTYRHPCGPDTSEAVLGPGSAEEEGVAALARALEHVHALWALAGCILRIPGVNRALQLIVDASGGQPGRVARGAPACETSPES